MKIRKVEIALILLVLFELLVIIFISLNAIKDAPSRAKTVEKFRVVREIVLTDTTYDFPETIDTSYVDEDGVGHINFKTDEFYARINRLKY